MSTKKKTFQIGNKTDKLSSKQIRELKIACPHQVLMSSVSSEHNCIKKIEQFFTEVLNIIYYIYIFIYMKT